MKVAFFHDVKIIEKDSKMYSVDFGHEVWERYLKVFDEVVVCTRREKKNKDVSKYKISSTSKVDFRLNEEYNSPIQYFIDRKNINKKIKKVVEDADACIIRLPSIIGILAAKESIKQKKPWAVEVVGCSWDSLWNYGNIQGKILAPIMYILNRKYINKATHVIYVSQKFLQKRYPNSNFIAGASDVKIENIESELIDKRIKSIEQIDKDKQIILGLIGSLDVEYKGHRTAIMAVKMLKNRGYNVLLKCLGGGNSDRWIKLCEELEIDDNVEFCGTLPSGRAVLEWLDNINIFIMPSLTEGLPRSMIEAMSRGCNIIGSNVGGIPELISNEFTFKPKNYKALTNIIISLINNKEKMIEQSKINIEESKLYNKDIVEKYRTIFYENFYLSIKNKSNKDENYEKEINKHYNNNI